MQSVYIVVPLEAFGQVVVVAFLFLVPTLFVINVQAEWTTENIINETAEIPNGHYRWHRFLAWRENIQLSVVMDVVVGSPINIIVFNETNFDLWSDGNQAHGWVRNHALNTNFTVTLNDLGILLSRSGQHNERRQCTNRRIG